MLSVLLALGWGAVRDWLHEVERYASATVALACRVLRRSSGEILHPRGRPCDDLAPRHLFGDAFESRPPPLSA